MNMNKDLKIALIIKTNGLEYDDRVRKEINCPKDISPAKIL